MAQTFLTIGMVTYEMLAVLHNLTVAAKKANRKYDKQFAKEGAKIGAQVQIRKPPLYPVTDGPVFISSDYTEESVPLIVDHHKKVGVEFLNDDLVLSMDDFSGRFLKPGLVPLANAVDVDVMANYFLAWNATGTPGTIAATDTPFLDAKTLLHANAAPGDMWPEIVSNTVSARLSSGLAGRFNPQKDIGGLFIRGSMGPALGWDFYETQNTPVHTTGAWADNGATTLEVNAANQIGANIICKNAAATIVGLGKKGDIVQFAGVYGVNPITKLNTGLLQNFVLTADVNSDGGGAFTLPINPSIILAGTGQTVTASPAASAFVYVWGFGGAVGQVGNVASKTSPQCLGWAQEAVTLAMVDLYVFEAGEGIKATRAQDDDLGMSVLYCRGADIREFSRISRLDVLYGTTFPRPEHVARTAS